MSDDKKTVEYFEEKKGMLIIGANPKAMVTEAEFDSVPMAKKIGVNHSDRIKFLQDNGYEVTRENMIDSQLSVTVNNLERVQ